MSGILSAIQGVVGGASSAPISILQYQALSTADGSAGLTVPFTGVLVAGAGTAAANGVYTQRGAHNGRPYYNLAGTSASISNNVIVWDGSQWSLNTPVGDVWYTNNAEDVAFPWLSAMWATADGADPAPTVTQATTVLTAGSTLIACISLDSTTSLSGTPTLTPSGNVSALKAQTGTGMKVSINRAIAAGGETAFHCATGGAVRLSVQLVEVANLSSGAAEGTASATDNSNDVAPGTITPISLNNVLLMIGAFDSASVLDTAPAGFTRLGSGTGGPNVSQESFYIIQSLATPQSPDMVLDSSAEWASAAVAIGGA